jgi:hypothetical protein
MVNSLAVSIFSIYYEILSLVVYYFYGDDGSKNTLSHLKEYIRGGKLMMNVWRDTISGDILSVQLPLLSQWIKVQICINQEKISRVYQFFIENLCSLLLFQFQKRISFLLFGSKKHSLRYLHDSISFYGEKEKLNIINNSFTNEILSRVYNYI